MIVDSTGSVKQTIGISKEYKASIDIENLDFIATLLSSNLYSNPEESFIREIVSNGWDAHVAAGTTDIPLIVKITRNSYDNYDITIRDFGTGLSVEEFENLYCKIGGSTKRNSNDYIGCFGLGHLSPLSVSKVVYITSYYEGRERLYIMTKDGNSITTNFIDDRPTDKHNGLEVTVKGIKDVSQYKDALTNLIMFPNVYIDYPPFNNINSIKVKRYKAFCAASTHLSNKILLGNVLYPLSSSILPNELQQFIYSIANSGVVIKFDIGELTVTPNRESIIYNSATNKIIINRITEAKNEIESLLAKHINKDFTDPYEYSYLYKRDFIYNLIEDELCLGSYDSTNSNPRFNISMFNVSPTLRGKVVKSVSAIDRCKGLQLSTVKGVLYDNRIYSKKYPYAVSYRTMQDPTVPVIIVDDKTILTKYIKAYIAENYRKCIISTPCSEAHYKNEYINSLYRRTSFGDADEEYAVECCYKHYLSRCKNESFNTKEFLDFKDSLKQAAKSSKVLDNEKVILTVFRRSEYHPEHVYNNKIEKSNYKEALSYIKGFKCGIIIRNLDDLATAPLLVSLGYVVISANKKVVERLREEPFNSKVCYDDLFKNKNLITLNTLAQLTVEESCELRHACASKMFLDTLQLPLVSRAKSLLQVFSLGSDYKTALFIKSHSEQIGVDNKLLEDIKSIIEKFKYYTEAKDILGDMQGSSVGDLISYMIMKDKKYRISYCAYSKLKTNNFLKKLCQK